MQRKESQTKSRTRKGKLSAAEKKTGTLRGACLSAYDYSAIRLLGAAAARYSIISSGVRSALLEKPMPLL